MMLIAAMLICAVLIGGVVCLIFKMCAREQELPRKEEEGGRGEIYFMAPECDDEGYSTHRRNLPNMKAPCLSFAARVLNHITERKLLPSDVYKRGEISRQNYSRIIAADDSKVNKLTAMQFCIGLKLSKADSDNLLRTAGYAFSDVLKEDKAFSYCIEHELWSIDEVRKRM